MTAPLTPVALVAALNREPIELADGVTPEEVMRLALNGIDIAYRAHGDRARVSLLAVQADWIMQHLARTEAWAKDEQAKRHAAEDKLVEARSRAATAEAAHQQVTAERDEARVEYERGIEHRNDLMDRVVSLKTSLAAAKSREDTATSELARLRERLEIAHAYDGAGNKIPFPEGMERLDGIECRDETIRNLEEQVARLRVEGEAKDRALKPFADVCDAEHMRHVRDEQVLELSTRSEVTVSEKLRGAHFRAARAATARER